MRDVVARALLVEFVGEGLLGRGLEFRVEGRGDDDVLVDRADGLVEQIHHVIGRIIDAAGAAVAHHLRGPREGELRHRLGDVALLGHGGDDLRGAVGRRLVVAVGREFRRRLHQAREHRGLR